MSKHIVCDHCGYVEQDLSKYPERLQHPGDDSGWMCPACNLCNTVYLTDQGYRTELGYNRDLQVGYL